MKEVVVYETDNQLAKMIEDYKGCSQGTVEMTTQPTFNKKSRVTKEPYELVFKGNVLCTSIRYISIGNSYAQAVQNRLVAEGKLEIEKAVDFTTGSLPWGTWVEGSKILITHKDVIYLRLSYLNANNDNLKKIYHYENGKELSDEEVERLSEFLPPPSTENKYDLDKPVIVNSVKVSGITSLRFDAKVFVRKGYESNEDKATLKMAKAIYGAPMMAPPTYAKFTSIKKDEEIKEYYKNPKHNNSRINYLTGL